MPVFPVKIFLNYIAKHSYFEELLWAIQFVYNLLIP